MLISTDNASFSYGDNLIFKNVTFSVNEGERVGLIGANGEGKTTLIKLILGVYTADSGSVIKKNGIRIGYLEQNGGYSSGNTVYAEMLSVFGAELKAIEKLQALSEELSVTPPDTSEYLALTSQIEKLNGYIASKDAYNVEVRIKTVLNGMGFSDRYAQIIDTMSGGEKTRLKLARLLLEQPDLLILDEPTNHLDIQTLFWLEDYLLNFRGALLVVSHDRYFLDKLTQRILEIENKTLRSFTGNYSKYKVLKAELNARLLKEYEAQQEERAKLQDYVDRNIVRATTAKSAQSRVKQLEKMEILEKPYVPPRPPVFKFTYENSPYENVLTIRNLELEIDGKRLISGGQMLVRRGDKVAITGENGTGKSTLLHAVMKGGNPCIELGRFVKLAFYDQEATNLNPENTVISEMWDRHIGFTQTEIRSELARCGLFGEDMQKTVKSLSGGERAKLALCILESEHGNVLLLDEPTNHLDLPARESLEKALSEFDGTLIFVSHDRYFLNALAGRTAEIEDGKLNVFDGGYTAFNEYKQRKNAEKARAEEQVKYEKTKLEKESSYRSKKERAEEAKRKQLAKQLETEITALEAEEAELNEKLADPSVVSDYVAVNGVMERLNKLKNRLDILYKQYEAVI